MIWLARHAQAFFYSLGQLWRTPFSLIMTAAVIGIALALPTGLHVLLKNAQQLSHNWDGAPKLSMFLATTATEAQARKLQSDIQQRLQVAEVQLVTRDAALTEFKQHSGFGDALNALQDNPLPHVLIVTPASNQSDPLKLDLLAQQLRSLPQVDSVQLDREWVKRLYAIMATVSRGIDILAAMLALGVILVVGNTIRLAIQNRRDEIVVIKLIGGTDAFIRRPFLYTGFWYGLLGGFIAILLVFISLWLLSGPVELLTGLYQSSFTLIRLDFLTMLTMLAISIALGLAGSWLAVGRHLREIEPR